MRRHAPGLAARLLAAPLLVITTGGLTLAVVPLAAGPPLFRVHIRRALGSVSPEVSRHLQDAFAAAGGIGLTIARALIAARGGSLTAASDGPGTGAQFTITLPLGPT